MDEMNILDKAVKDFDKTFKTKTGKAKGYTAIEMSFEKKEAKEEEKKGDVEYEPSKLDSQVYGFVEFINNKKMMEKTMTDAGYDIKKLPLGNLSDKTVNEGYLVLGKLSDIFNKISKGKSTLDKEMTEVKKLSSEFYTYIPHNFGFQKMENFILKTDEMVKQKLELINNLVEINTAINLQKKNKKAGVVTASKLEPNPMD